MAYLGRVPQRQNIRMPLPRFHELVHAVMHSTLAKICNFESCGKRLKPIRYITRVPVIGNISDEYIRRRRWFTVYFKGAFQFMQFRDGEICYSLHLINARDHRQVYVEKHHAFMPGAL